jgi:EmrB/QacA subfamily drug resistance transporter
LSDVRNSAVRTSDNVILALVCVAQFMVILDVNVVNVALPEIGSDLHYSPTGLQWVVNAYTLTCGGFLLLGGRLADLFGRRRIFILGLALFSLASLAGGFAQTSTELTAARALQGVGAAVLSPTSLTIVMATFGPGPSRHRAIGLWSAISGAGGALGGIIGGVLTTYLSWRWVLFVNVPIGLVAGVTAVAVLTEGRRPDAERHLDLAGALTVTAGLVVLVYAIVGTDTHSWTSPRTLLLLLAAMALFAIFLISQAKFSASPLMPLGFFRSRSVSAANFVMLLAGVAFFSVWYFLSLYFQDVHGFSPLRSGVYFLPMSACVIVGARLSSRLIATIGTRAILICGLISATVGLYTLSKLTASSGFSSGILVPGALTALGIGLSLPPLASAATTVVPPHLAGLASGLLSMSRQVGGSIGLAALTTIATARTSSLIGGGIIARDGIFYGGEPFAKSPASKSLQGPNIYWQETFAPNTHALAAGYDRAFLIAAGVTLVAAAVAVLLPGRDAERPSSSQVANEV